MFQPCERLTEVRPDQFCDPTSQVVSGNIGGRDVMFYRVEEKGITPNPRAMCALTVGANSVMHGAICFKCGNKIFLRDVIKK